MVFRVNKTGKYTVMANIHLRDMNLSLKAKGLLSQMLSLPQDWDYSIEGLVSINRESQSAIKAALDELKQNGYVVVNKLLPDKTKSKRIEYIYDIYEAPHQAYGFQGVENQEVENQEVDFQAVENRRQQNKDIQSTEEQNTEVQSTENKVFASAELNEAFEQWLRYKKERQQTYRETGLQTLIRKLKKAESDYGSHATAEAIYTSITNGWAGLFFDKLKKPELDETKTDLDDIF